MRINKLEYIAPSQANPLGSVSLDVEIPVIYKEGMKDVADKENADVELSAETVALLQQLAQAIIKDLTKEKI